MPPNYFDQFDTPAAPAAPAPAPAQGNYFDQFDTAPASAQQKSDYSWGPVSDVAELGARGFNWLAQKFGASPRAPQPMGQEVNLPIIGKPSAVGMAQGLYEQGKSA